jgi:4-hydroxy-2-oxoheptanedioate aldolase
MSKELVSAKQALQSSKFTALTLPVMSDAIFIGPNDLAMSLLGYAPADYTEQVFLNAIERIRTAAHAAGIKVGILAPDGFKGRSYRGTFDMVGCGGDVKALQGWMAAALTEAKS